MLGGPRIATFVAINLGGPEIHSIYWWRNQHRVDISGGIQESNFKKLGPLYKEAMANISSTSVPVLAAEDETAIIGHVTYHQDADELLGFCGVNGQHHACLDHLLLKLGMAKKVSRILLMPSRSTRSVPSGGQYCSTNSIQIFPELP